MYNPEKITYFGETDSRNKHVSFGIKARDRSKHVYVIGKTGMGKSTLLENMAIQDIQSGEGIVFIDPHGGTAEKLLEYVPESRIKDVIYFAPFDMDNPIAFNIMEDVGADKRHLVVNGLMSVFEKIWEDAWSARMAYILQNTLLALLEYPGATLLAVNRMYTDKEFRLKVVDNVTDVSVKSFWTEEYAKYTDKYAQEATPAIQNKIGQFAGNPLIRNIIGQPKSSFDLRQIMDTQKIMIVNLSKGRVGEGNARLLGSMLITKIYLAAMSRADEPKEVLQKLPNLYLHVDEFQSFADKSFADILSEARKYKLNLTMAHQYIEQMEEEVRDAVFGNVGTMITFRVGAYDAEVLEKEFAPVFTAEDLVNLGLRQICLKLMIDDVTSQPFSATTLPPIKPAEASHVDEIIRQSRRTYAHPKAEVEKVIQDWHDQGKTATKAPMPSDPFPKRRYEPERRVEPRRQTERAYTPKPAYAPRPVAQVSPPPSAPRPVPKPDIPQDDAGFTPIKSISLDKLKESSNNQRPASQKNVSDLKSALANIAKVSPSQPPAPPKATQDNPQYKKKEPTPEELKAILNG
ncbi:type IV secretion system DNA-binding domain-containing protein [Candidatus Parcubacteria bacterium]|nr:type IV secretion system DNA-binding domain-containing protein [Candidatus Parcubacteria bacterium]